MGPFLPPAVLWQRHVDAALATIAEALLLLRGSDTVAMSEQHLNRELYRCLLAAYRKRITAGSDVPLAAPMAEARNQPDATQRVRAAREDKIPDFQFTVIDHLEPDVGRSAKAFCVECKRLGPPDRKDWVLSVNYVLHGISRFRNAEHGYGYGVATGAMVGYVQESELVSLLTEVNECAVGNAIEEIPAPPMGFVAGGVTRFDHHVLRRSYPVTPFTLHHLWIDIREPVALLRKTATQGRRKRRAKSS